MQPQRDRIRDRVFYVRQELRKIFGGLEFTVRVVIDRGRTRVHIQPVFRYDRERLTLDEKNEIARISEHYSNDGPLCPWDEMQLQKVGGE